MVLYRLYSTALFGSHTKVLLSLKDGQTEQFCVCRFPPAQRRV